MQLRYIFPTLRSFAGWGRYLSTGKLKRIPIEFVTNEFAFAFSPDGWNYFRALVAEYEQHPNLDLEKSTFFRFFQHDQVKSVRYLNDILFLHDPVRQKRGCKFYLGTYPWGDHVGGGPWGHYYDLLAGNDTRDLYGYRANIWYEPGDKVPIEREWKGTLNLYESLKKKGYQPLRHRDIPEVTLLLRRDGAMRAVRYNGQHRLSILSHVGHKHVTALVPSVQSINDSLKTWTTFSNLPKVVYENEVVVRETDVQQWHYVKQGLCTVDQALEIFHAFFELNGRERIKYLNIPSAY
jgi:hypothetical protein